MESDIPMGLEMVDATTSKLGADMTDELIKRLREEAKALASSFSDDVFGPLFEAAAMIEQQAALILSLESRTAQQARTIAAMCQQVADLKPTVAPAVDALTDDRIIDIAYECNAAPSVPESTLIDFARRIRYE
jgi:uncharacterized coiled-coil protein SlyX